MKQISLSIISILLLAPQLLHTCLLDITNDTDQDANLVLIDGTESTIIPAGAKGQFGSKKKRPHFNLLLRNRETGLFNYACTVEQIACSPTKDDVFISINGFLNNTLPEATRSMFTIKKNNLKKLSSTHHAEESDSNTEEDQDMENMRDIQNM